MEGSKVVPNAHDEKQNAITPIYQEDLCCSSLPYLMREYLIQQSTSGVQNGMRECRSRAVCTHSDVPHCVGPKLSDVAHDLTADAEPSFRVTHRGQVGDPFRSTSDMYAKKR